MSSKHTFVNVIQISLTLCVSLVCVCSSPVGHRISFPTSASESTFTSSSSPPKHASIDAWNKLFHHPSTASKAPQQENLTSGWIDSLTSAWEEHEWLLRRNSTATLVEIKRFLLSSNPLFFTYHLAVAEHFADVFDLSDLQFVLDTSASAFRHNTTRMVPHIDFQLLHHRYDSKSKQVQVIEYAFDPTEREVNFGNIMAAVKQGFTLVVRAMNVRSLTVAGLAEHMMLLFGYRVHIDMHFTPPIGFTPPPTSESKKKKRRIDLKFQQPKTPVTDQPTLHYFPQYESISMFVLQLVGSKRWNLWPFENRSSDIFVPSSASTSTSSSSSSYSSSSSVSSFAPRQPFYLDQSLFNPNSSHLMKYIQSNMNDVKHRRLWPGSVLYIPPGMIHESTLLSVPVPTSSSSSSSSNEMNDHHPMTMHLTIGVEVDTIFTVAGFLHLMLSHAAKQKEDIKVLSLPVANTAEKKCGLYQLPSEIEGTKVNHAAAGLPEPSWRLWQWRHLLQLALFELSLRPEMYELRKTLSLFPITMMKDLMKEAKSDEERASMLERQMTRVSDDMDWILGSSSVPSSSSPPPSSPTPSLSHGERVRLTLSRSLHLLSDHLSLERAVDPKNLCRLLKSIKLAPSKAKAAAALLQWSEAELTALAREQADKDFASEAMATLKCESVHLVALKNESLVHPNLLEWMDLPLSGVDESNPAETFSAASVFGALGAQKVRECLPELSKSLANYIRDLNEVYLPMPSASTTKKISSSSKKSTKSAAVAATSSSSSNQHIPHPSAYLEEVATQFEALVAQSRVNALKRQRMHLKNNLTKQQAWFRDRAKKMEAAKNRQRDEL